MSLTEEELCEELRLLEEEIIPKTQKDLEWLTSPDYKPEDNPDHAERDADIEYLTSELNEAIRRAAQIKQRLER
jgi:hypothetical protein